MPFLYHTQIAQFLHSDLVQIFASFNSRSHVNFFLYKINLLTSVPQATHYSAECWRLNGNEQK
jgi:hypothetical protein